MSRHQSLAHSASARASARYDEQHESYSATRVQAVGDAVVAIILSIPFDVRLTRAPDSWPIILLNPKEARRYRIEIMGIALLVVAVVDERRAGTCRALNWSIRRRVFSTICGAIGSFSPCPTCGYTS